MSWPPEVGEIWIANDDWDASGGPEVQKGEPLLVLEVLDVPACDVYDIGVLAAGGPRRLWVMRDPDLTGIRT